MNRSQFLRSLGFVALGVGCVVVVVARVSLVVYHRDWTETQVLMNWLPLWISAAICLVVGSALLAIGHSRSRV